jgi:hypothetical protein
MNDQICVNPHQGPDVPKGPFQTHTGDYMNIDGTSLNRAMDCPSN